MQTVGRVQLLLVKRSSGLEAVTSLHLDDVLIWDTIAVRNLDIISYIRSMQLRITGLKIYLIVSQ